MTQPNDLRGAQRAKINEPVAHTNPEDTLLEHAPVGTGKLTPQRPGTGGSGPAISWLFVVLALAAVVLLAYGLVGR